MHTLTTETRRTDRVIEWTGSIAFASGMLIAAGLALAAVPVLVAVAALTPAACATVVDVRDRRLPDRLVALTTTPVLAASLMRASLGDHDTLVRATLGAVAFAVPLLVLHAISPAAMGFGDVKFAASLGAVLGLLDPRSVVVALIVASAGTAVVATVRGRAEIPFGPGLLVGTIAALATTIWVPLEGVT
jgi:leader peptidase (prepilin peptidase)/N-methyltransferase